MYVKYEKNIAGSDYVVGDIHGCFSMLRRALDKIGFNPETDRLFSVGDLVDRGPENEQVLDWLREPWFHPVRGNHDEFVANHDEIGHMRETHLYNGGHWFVSLDDVDKWPYVYAMLHLPIAIEVETDDGTVGIVHAEVPNDDWNWFKDKLLYRDYQAEHIDHVAMWSRNRIRLHQSGVDVPDVAGIDLVCVGHTVVKEADNVGNVLYLDTGAVSRGVFTLACIQGPKANQLFRIEEEVQ